MKNRLQKNRLQPWTVRRVLLRILPLTWMAGVAAWLSPAAQSPAQSQVIPTAAGAGTQVTETGDQYDIEGGTQSGGNLFHEFDEFSLTGDETANFLGDSGVFNIVGQVSGANPSYIDGTLQVSGSDANLYLVNPSGVLFGTNAQLSLQGSFTATTADQVEFDGAVLNVLDQGADYSAFSGDPSALHFTETSASAVVNQGDLTVAPGESISLTGGNVVNAGTLSAPGGEIGLVAVGGESTVRYGMPGSLLSLELTESLVPNVTGFSVTDLPALLTGSSIPLADELVLQPDGSYKLGPLQIEAEEVSVTGEISTRATAGDGGAIALLGRSVDVLGAVIDASGDNGGNIRIGRDVGGSGTLPTSDLVMMNRTSVVRADGLDGAGGDVAIGSTLRATVQSDISAQGTTTGGLVETSSPSLNSYNLRVDASGQSEGGRWLAAANNIDIVSNSLSFNQLDPSVIEATLDSGTDIEITTAIAPSGNGDIVLSESIAQNGGGSADLTLTGRRFINSGSTIDLSTAGQLTFGINQVNAELTPDSSSIESAIAAIGNVNGDRLVRLGAGNYGFTSTLPLNSDVEIEGAGASDTVLTTLVDGNRLLFVASGIEAAVSDVTFTTVGLAANEIGGGIFNQGTLTIDNSHFVDNRATQNGGAIDSFDAGSLVISNSEFRDNRSADNGSGGAIHLGNTSGTNRISNTLFENNYSPNSGGAVNASNARLTIDSGSHFVDNTANAGGAVRTSGGTFAELNTVTFEGNSAAVQGGAIVVGGGGRAEFNNNIFTDNESVRGGAISIVAAGVTDTDSVFSSNRALNGGSGGAIYVGGGGRLNSDGVSFTGNTTATGDGGAIAAESGVVNVTDTAFARNEAAHDGGGISLQYDSVGTVANSSFTLNQAGDDGGGLYLSAGSAITVENTQVLNNSAVDGGGGLYASFGSSLQVSDTTVDGNSATDGGGLRLRESSTAMVEGGSFTNNSAVDGGAISVDSSDTTLQSVDIFDNTAKVQGGGVAQRAGTLVINASELQRNETNGHGGGLYSEGLLTVNNTTFSGNRAELSGGGLYSVGEASVSESRFENNEAQDGGGISAQGQGDLTLTDVKIIDNQASRTSGGVDLGDEAQLEITGTLSVDADGMATTATTQLVGNVAGADGGAIEAGGNSRLVVDGVLFRDNEAGDDGGGIAVTRAAEVVIDNSNFERNQSADNGGGLYRNDSVQSSPVGVTNVRFTRSRLIENQAANDGGGVFLGESSGQVTLSESLLRANDATANGGGIYSGRNSSLQLDNSKLADNQAIAGGGLYSTGDNTVTDSLVEGNEAENGGGIVILENASLALDDTIVRNNRAVNGYGGGLLVSDDASATVTGVLSTDANGLAMTGTTRFEANTAGQDGGGIASHSSAYVITDGVLFQNNIAGDDGGGVAVLEASRAVVNNSNFENNRAADNGGGLYSNHFGPDIPGGDKAVVDNSRFINNEAADGGGFYQGLGGTATVSNSLFRANQATADGGALYGERDIAIAETEIIENVAQYGGGILIDGDANLRLANSTLEANRATDGGGLFNRSVVELTNTTFSNNVATNEGGGIKNAGANAILTVRNSTVYENEASQGGGILADSAQTTRVLNTIVAGNVVAGNVSATGHDVSGSFEDQGNNLIGRAEGSFGFVNSALVGTATAPIDPRLASLADNGGLTRTHLLRSDSLAINAGRADGLPATDQRGLVRVAGTAVDIGAVELDATEIRPDLVEEGVPTTVSFADPTLLPDAVERSSVDSAGELLGNRDTERFSDNESIRRLEQNFGQGYEDYWDLPQGKELSFDQVQAILRRAQSEYEVNSAVIYAAFVPEETAQEEDSKILEFETEPSGNDLLHLAVVMPDGDLARYESPVTRREAERQVRMLRSTTADPEDNFSYRPLSQQLYQWLLAPLEADLAEQGIQNLMYVLDRGLRTAPVGSMRDYNGFSLERYGISVLPNVSLMQADFPASVRRPTIAMGVSEFDVEQPLPAVPIELDVVKSTVPVSQTLLNESTTSDAIASIQALEQPGVLHLATHASFDTHSPDSSSIELWDGPLSMREFSELDWQASNLELLILSACSTAMSSPNAELGFAGLAAAAGVDATVGSLWQVSDIGTLALMSEFYTQLESTPLRFEALRQAQLSLLKKETRIENGNLITSAGEVDLPDEWDLPADVTLDHPFFWSAFTMVGNPW